MSFHKHHLVLLVFAAALCGIAATDAVNGTHFSGKPPVSRTGAPGELTCTLCHTGTANSGSGSLTLAGLPQSGYQPGVTYALTVTVNDTSQSAATRNYGFQATALNVDNQAIGSWAVTNSSNTGVDTAAVSGASRTYIRHKAASNNNSWSFDWTAPASSEEVNFYVAGMAANGNAAGTGDLVYTHSFALMPASSAVQEVSPSLSLSAFPNPTCDFIRVNVPQSAERLELLDNAGRVVRTVTRPVAETEVSLVGLPAGVYLMRASLREGGMVSASVVKE